LWCWFVGAGVDDIRAHSFGGGDGRSETDGGLCGQHHFSSLPVSKPAGSVDCLLMSDDAF